VRISAGVGALLFAAAVAAAPRSKPTVTVPRDLSREAAVNACAKCHPRVFEEWKAGPHANAVRMLKIEFEDNLAGLPEGSIEEEKRKLLNSICVDCHQSPVNMYEGILDAHWDGKGSLSVDERGKELAVLSRADGIDCLTCHGKGKRVVTRADFVPNPKLKIPENYCNPIPSKTFSHLYNCASCHAGAVEATVERFNRREVGHCVDCHLARDDSGKKTHYFLWSANERKIKTMIKNMFDAFSVSIRRSEGRSQLLLDWPTEFTPHRLIPDTPKLYRVRIEVLDENGEARFERVVRFYDESPAFGRSELSFRPTNTTGELVSLKAGERFKRVYDLPESIPANGSILLTVGKKSKFYKSESQASLVYERETNYAY